LLYYVIWYKTLKYYDKKDKVVVKVENMLYDIICKIFGDRRRRLL